MAYFKCGSSKKKIACPRQYVNANTTLTEETIEIGQFTNATCEVPFAGYIEEETITVWGIVASEKTNLGTFGKDRLTVSIAGYDSLQFTTSDGIRTVIVALS